MKITGFTLFWSEGKKAWQRSIRPEGENGWLVDHISDEEAQHLFYAASLAGTYYSTIRARRDLTAALREFINGLA